VVKEGQYGFGLNVVEIQNPPGESASRAEYGRATLPIAVSPWQCAVDRRDCRAASSDSRTEFGTVAAPCSGGFRPSRRANLDTGSHRVPTGKL